MPRTSIVVSLRARGVNTFQYSQAFDFSNQAHSLGKQLADIGCSGVVFLQLQSWSTWISLLLTLLASVFYDTYDDGHTKLTGSYWMLLCFLVVLPLIGALFQAFCRRENAFRQLAKVKALALAIHSTFQDSLPAKHSHCGVEMQLFLQQMLNDMRAYCQHERRYARHYTNPFISNDPIPTKILYNMSKELGLHITTMQQHFRNLHRSCRQLEEVGGSSSAVIHLRGCVLELHTAFEQLSIIKEYRSPQALRSMLRFYILIILPVFGSPYWVYLGKEVGKFAHAVTLGLLVQLVLGGLLTCVIGLEDPFNEAALDSVCATELLDHCNMMLEGYGTRPPPVAGTAAPTLKDPNLLQPSQPRKPAATPSPHPPPHATLPPTAAPSPGPTPRFVPPPTPSHSASKANAVMPPMPPLVVSTYPNGATDSEV